MSRGRARRLRLPPRVFRNGYLIRGAVLWVGLHLVMASPPIGIGLFNAPSIVFMTAAVFAVAAVDTATRGDRVFLADLGVNPLWAPGLTALVALGLEIAARSVGPWL